jgi:hypothetical protein
MVAAILAIVCFSPTPSKAGQEPEPPSGFKAIFNGKDLAGWCGREQCDPIKFGELGDSERQAAADADLAKHWRVEGGEIVNDGHGVFLTTTEDFTDFELTLDWKMTNSKTDSGVYIRGCPQVQIWDPEDQSQWKHGARLGSGGLWNNNPGAPGKDPLVRADRPVGEWNTLRIQVTGDRVTVHLNGQLVVENAVMHNYWNRDAKLYERGPIQLQTHGGEMRFRNVYLRQIDNSASKAAEETTEIQRKHSDWKPLFDGKTLTGWTGAVDGYEVRDGAICCNPKTGGKLFNLNEYSDFALRFEFLLTPGANNGLAIRAPLQGDPAYDGIELQILDDTAAAYKDLQPYQYNGSAYGIAAARRGFAETVGEWNEQVVRCEGRQITVTLNGEKILDIDLDEAAPQGKTLDGKSHPGLARNFGHIGFLGHGSDVRFRNICVLNLSRSVAAK